MSRRVSLGRRRGHHEEHGGRIGKIHDRLMRRLAEAGGSHVYDPPEDPANLFGPLTNHQAQRRVANYLAIGRREPICFIWVGFRGPDHLRQILWTRVVSEHTLRYGFVLSGADTA